MKRFHLRMRWLFLTLLVLAVGAGAAYAAIAYRPDWPPGQWWFAHQYGHGADKAAILGEYLQRLGRIGRSVPAETRGFLASRYAVSREEAERDLLADFFADQRRDTRPLPEGLLAVREELAGRLMSRLPGYFEGRKLGALALVEELRRGRPLSRAVLARRGGVAEGSLPREVLGAYQAWWNGGGNWANKQAIDPLQTTAFYWLEP